MVVFDMSPATELNADVINLIFEYIEDDIPALYNSILVNKYIYDKLIPLLYKNPFHYMNTLLRGTINKTIRNKCRALITTYIKCLPLDRQLFYHKVGVIEKPSYPRHQHEQYLRSLTINHFIGSLNATKYHQIADSHGVFYHDLITLLVTGKKQLQMLHIEDTHFHIFEDFLQDLSPSLKSLRLDMKYYINEDISHLINNLPNIESLVISFAKPEIDYDLLENMGRIKESLVRLDIEGDLGKIDFKFLHIMKEYKQLKVIYIRKHEHLCS
ncbi:2465_t:CDS:1 [Paraglomus occultum]|uniref:2465_t:CDS:1 n=1 Tax=Paraglomus occultum TaxID=144539 RepID=A0A9N9BYA1_9GLOM|nr:2465_t:CDS:1 [Paraglomus occultum]